MKLFYYPHAPYSRKVLLAAYEKRATFERVVSLPFASEDRARIKAIHPLATVPLLVDGDDVLTESSIIAERFDLVPSDAPPLLSSDRETALAARAIDRFSDSHLMGPCAYLAWSVRKPEGTRNDAKIAAQRAALDTALGILDAKLATRAFLSGDAFGFGDLSAAAAVSCMLADGTLASLDRFASLARWFDTVHARESFAAIDEECRRVPLPAGF